jgi:bifunctional DNase/RNase
MQRRYLSLPEKCHVCGSVGLIRYHVARHRRWVQDYVFCDEHADEMVRRNYDDSSRIADPFPSACRFDIESLIVKKEVWDGRYYLREEAGVRYFTATMGYCECVALYLGILEPEARRPTAHHLLANTISAIGGSLQDVFIYAFEKSGDCFVADCRIHRGDESELIRVDARPSDALSLAVASGVPILVSEEAWRISMQQDI